MTPPERDPADVDRVFAEMTAHWRLDDPDPESPPRDAAPERPAPDSRAPDRPAPDGPAPDGDGTGWVRDHPLFHQREELDEPTEELFRWQEPPRPEPPEEPEDGWFERPEVTPIPWGSLSLPALLGGSMLAFTVAVLLLSVLGVRFPTVVGYLAVASFVLGFGVLMTRLRRSDDTDPGHGAQL